MAFALTKAYAYPELISSPTPLRRGNQVIELEFTGTVDDVDVDIGDLTGTFWGDVDASSVGAEVLAKITSLYPSFDDTGCIKIESAELIDRVQVASLTTTGQFSVALNATTLLPEIAVNAADGELAWKIRITARLNDSELGTTWSYSS